MENIRTKAEIILVELKKQIVDMVDAGKFEEGAFFLEQYIKLAPADVERYSLEALLKSSQGDWEGAENVLNEGILNHPLSFDLLYNLGYLHEKRKNIFEAYHIYMKARYITQTDAEKKDIGIALKGLVNDFRGKVETRENKISTIVKAGELTMTLTVKTEVLLYRKSLLENVQRNLAKNASSILEIGFRDGIISKNLNYFGYEVTAVDGDKDKILQVIAREWHDNILHPEQRVAKFYHELVNLEWLKKIPKFDVILAVGGNNLIEFGVQPEQSKEVLKALLAKAGKQLFLIVSVNPSESEFFKNDLQEIVQEQGLELKSITKIGKADGQDLELCLVKKDLGEGVFFVPQVMEVEQSKSTVFEVELSKCVDLYGAGYLNDWHPFVAVLKEYQSNPQLKYENSVLKSYYASFQPRNLEEGLFAIRGKAPKLRAGWIGYPWFWERSQLTVFQRELGETRPGGNHFFGPNTEKFGSEELLRLITLLQYFEEQEYHPELFSDGYISGYLMLKGNDYRFVVTEGQHRLACLAVLGYEKIRCRFTQQPQYPRIVNWQEVKAWPQVVNKVFTRSMALKIFDRFFEKDVGEERKSKLFI